jgi:hypothetical protein
VAYFVPRVTGFHFEINFTRHQLSFTTLKLTGVGSYMNAMIRQPDGEPVQVKKGDILRLPDSIAGKIGGLSRPGDNEEGIVYFFTNVQNATPTMRFRPENSYCVLETEGETSPAEGDEAVDTAKTEDAARPAVAQRVSPATKRTRSA